VNGGTGSGGTGSPAYATGSVTSRDGTVISYRQLGRGPGVIAVHGSMQAAQNLMKLARALADSFTVYLPDRRGRGRSGPPGSHYSLAAECEDIDALIQATGARSIFGLSSGAIIALQAALVLPAVGKAALYEPPLSVDGSTPVGWVARYDREVAQGKLASAVITAARGTQTAPPVLRFVPRIAVEMPLNAALRASGSRTAGPGSPADISPARHAALRVLGWPLRKAAARNQPPGEAGRRDDVPPQALIPTVHYDAQLVRETEGKLHTFASTPASVLLLGGSKSPSYLKTCLDALASVLPLAQRVELAGCGHLAPDNSGDPERVADELRSFFAR
jgi:pimeloyl-ACP methyl ester carboxylesterase